MRDKARDKEQREIDKYKDMAKRETKWSGRRQENTERKKVEIKKARKDMKKEINNEDERERDKKGNTERKK
jgi:hypothetical protein